jgi:hypothetical protein
MVDIHLGTNDLEGHGRVLDVPAWQQQQHTSAHASSMVDVHLGTDDLGGHGKTLNVPAWQQQQQQQQYDVSKRASLLSSRNLEQR